MMRHLRARVFLLLLFSGCVHGADPRVSADVKAAIGDAEGLTRECKYAAAEALVLPRLEGAKPADRAALLVAAGTVAEGRGDFDTALARYREAASAEQIPAEALRLLGLIQIRTKQFEDGRKNLYAYLVQHLKSGGSLDWTDLAALTVALAELGRVDEALRELDSARPKLSLYGLLLADLHELARKTVASGKKPGGEFWAMAYGTEEAVGVMYRGTSPSPVLRVVPAYPRLAYRDGVQGIVELLVSVDDKGVVQDAVAQKSLPPGVFEDAAKGAIFKWRFRPAMRDCKPVPSQFVQVFMFRTR